MGATPAEILAAALDFARRGIPVFPVMPTEKKKPFTANGFKDATTDEKQIRAWWKQWPKAMIGAPTGETSGFWVLDPDVDAKKNLDGPAELNKLLTIHGPLPPTRGVVTPRGYHYHFRMNGADIRNSASKVAPGIDVRGTGGYIVLPPSVRTNGAAYQWRGSINDALADAPDWLLTLAREANSKTRARKSRPQSQRRAKGSTADERWARKILEEECALIAAAPEGERNDTLNARGYNLFSLIGGGYLDESEVRSRLWTAAAANGSVADDADEVRGTIASASAGIGSPRYRPQLQISTRSNGGGSPPSGPQPTSGAGGGGGSGMPPLPPLGPSVGGQPGLGPGPQPIPGARRPVIQLVEGELPRIVDEAEAALVADIARQQLYQRGELVVRPVRLKLRAADMQGNKRETSGWQLVQVTKPYMIETFTRVARFERWNERAEDWTAKNCPQWVAETYLARVGRWKIPVLLRIVNCPFLRIDGSLCERPGYDPDGALLYIGGQGFPSVPAAPTLEQARDALDYLDGTLFGEFPFVDERVDRSVALSLVLTALDRHAMATAPLHAFTSPVAGTGKSLLIDLASLLATGDITPVISQGSNKDETEKRLGAELLSGNTIVSFDNCSSEVDSELLCQALTQRELRVRELGYSRNVKVPITALFTVNGNNLVIANDLTRRTLLGQLDAGIERPETRTFKCRVDEIARDQRGRLVAAGLTVLRGWHAAYAAGTKIGVEPMGSFEEWSHRIRCPLLWLDRADPCDSIKTVRENDPLRALLAAVLIQWEKALGTGAFTVQQVIDIATKRATGQLGIAGKPAVPPRPDFYHALTAVAGAAHGNGVSNDRLGRWLGRNNGKIVGRLKLVRVGIRNGYLLWQVVVV